MANDTVVCIAISQSIRLHYTLWRNGARDMIDSVGERRKVLHCKAIARSRIGDLRLFVRLSLRTEMHRCLRSAVDVVLINDRLHCVLAYSSCLLRLRERHAIRFD